MSDQLKLYFERLGAGPPVMILHGLFGRGRNWQSVAKNLSDKFDVIAVDLRNHGASPHASHMDYASMAGDVAALIDSLGLGSVCLIGHSMGGKTAMALALSEPAKIDHLIVVDISPGPYPNEYELILERLQQLKLDSIRRRADADAWLQPVVAEADVRLFILQNLVLSRGEPPTWRFNLQAIHACIDSLVGAIPDTGRSCFDGQTDFIRGENSNRINDHHLELIRRRFSQFRVTTIAGAGHWPHAERPAEFLAKLRTILSR